jgi:hypothetical protein
MIYGLAGTIYGSTGMIYGRSGGDVRVRTVLARKAGVSVDK